MVFQKEVIELASETVAYQNELMGEVTSNVNRNVNNVQVSVDKYPKLKKFRERASTE